MKAIEHLKDYLSTVNPVKLVLFGYVFYIVFGWIMLSLPISTVNFVGSLDNLFIATSAVSTTGLTTVSVSDSYTFFGEFVILLLIQLGGIGYMTFSSFVILTRKKQLPKNVSEVSQTVFSIPKNFVIEKFIYSVIFFTVIIETIGAFVLYFIFINEGVDNAIWQAIFHSVSAFCTAGFSLFNNSFVDFYNNFWLNLTISGLSFSGAIGFIVFVDYWRKIRRKTEAITLTSKIILRTTFYLVIFGTFLVFISEPSIADLPAHERLITSFFQVMTSITTVGFNTINVGGLMKSVLFFTTIYMIIGASPSGTGGGLKTTTFTAVYGLVKSTLQGKDDVYFWKAKVPKSRVNSAAAGFVFYFVVLALGVYILSLTENTDFISVAFEAASALGTVGLSMGLTSSLTVIGKVSIILLMLVGRTGPLTFGAALFVKPKLIFDNKETDLAI
ncbi:TrkH family potassium uptake protein [Geotoga petraea]|uniref:Trk system potassium uptake protein TrkH n=1 Tax=Geotoga petraea TaxID=28234 RepID=A0A1G6K3P6_9BACT|nr:potassium transporter TrkG [Geotoga petraea]SDC25672.1 trk system potassium uptake protein TrkH [Geotoga petraea]